MTEAAPPIPRAIERGLLRVRSLAWCEVEHAPTFHGSAKRWVVPVWLRIEQAAAFVGARTKWCVLIDEMYPYGPIEFYPAAEGGITVTFPHQERNAVDRECRGWRHGKLCLDSPFRGERRTTKAHDPVGDADARLRWHFERALEWLGAAATGRLLAPGDPFEVPFRPHTAHKGWASVRLVHDEPAGGTTAWNTQEGVFGAAEFGAIQGISNAIAVGALVDRTGATIRRWEGRQLSKLKEPVAGIWWLWPKPIVVPPWHTPGSWGELREAGMAVGVDVDATLGDLAPSLRGAKTDTILLLGYRMPARIGSTPAEIHWDGVLLPRLPPAAGKPPKGFRRNARGWWRRDRTELFADNSALVHLRTENWSGERLQARGRLPPTLRDARVAILGVGALGSTLGELLVRAGLMDIALVDGGEIAAGNVCRHVATLVDVGENKVRAVARRLVQISPSVRVSEVDAGVTANVDAMVEMLDPYDVIVDCTASDEALSLLARGWWSIPRVFASFSLGYGAHRLFCFGVTGQAFPQDRFTKDIVPWLEDESVTWAGSDELLEGAGCWSPLFPARHDDVMLAATICVKELDTLTKRRPREVRFRVFEKRESDDGFVGFSSGPLSPPSLEVTAS